MDGCDPLPDNLLCAPMASDTPAVVTKGNVDHIYTLENRYTLWMCHQGELEENALKGNCNCMAESLFPF